MVNEDEVLAALEEILVSPGFVRSERLKRFLRYVVREELAGRGSELNEDRLAIEVFDRDPNSRTRGSGTSIVRSEANRLRKKLNEYYEKRGSPSLVIAIERGSYRPHFQKNGQPQSDSSAAQVRLLVAPFQGDSKREDASALAGDLWRLLASQLSQLPDVVVIGDVSAVLASAGGDPLAAAERLRASHVVTGHVEIVQGVISVHAQLTDAAGGHLWKGEAQRPLAAALDTVNDITPAFAVAVGLRLEGVDLRTASAFETARPESLTLVARGNQLLARRTLAYAREALLYFDAANTLEEQTYARALAGRAEALLQLNVQHAADISPLKKAYDSACRAIELDPGLWEARAIHAASAWTLDWNLHRAGLLFTDCLRIDRRRTEHFYYYWLFLALQRDTPRALALAQRAAQADPLNFLIVGHLAFLAILHRDYSLSLDFAQQARKLMPSFYLADTYSALAAIGLRDWQLAYRHSASAHAHADGSSNTIGSLGFAAAKLGKVDEAHRLLREALETPHPGAQIAAIYGGLGDVESTCTWLERGVERQEEILKHLRQNPMTFDFVDHPRMQRLYRVVDQQLFGTSPAE